MPKKPTYEELEQRVEELEQGRQFQEAHENLESMVRERTEKLSEINEALQIEIAELRQVEKALRENEKLYRDIFEKNEAIKLLIDPYSGEIIDANPAACEFYQYNHENITSLRIWDINMLGETEIKKRMAKVISGEKTTFVFQHRLNSGEIRHVQVYSGILETGGKKLLHSIVIDRTERMRAEKALLESEEKFRLISEQSLMAIVIVQDDRIRYANQAYTEMTGYAWSEIMSWTMRDIIKTIHPDDLHFVMEQGRKKVAGISAGVVTHYAYRGLTKSGEVRWIDQYSKTITYRGRPANLLTFIDIHNQRLAQETLIESEKRYRDLADSLPQIVFETDENGTVTFVNRNAFDMFGYFQKDFNGAINILEMLIPEDRNRAMENMRRVMQSGSTRRNEYTALRKDGRTFPISMHANRLIHEGKFRGYRGIVIDLTQTKKAAEALRESEEKYRRIFENIQDAYYESSLDGTILEISPAIENISQYKREELIGMSVYDIYTDPRNRDEFLNLILKKGKLNDFEIFLKDKDGSARPCSITTSLLKDARGNPIKFVGSMRDISERKRGENERKKLERQLHRAQKMEAMGLLAGGVAHDLNNILSGIISYPELLLLDLPEDSPLRRPIKTIQESGMRAADVVADLLTIARGVATGKKVLNINMIVTEYLSSPEYLKLRETHELVNLRTELEPDLLNMRGSLTHIKKTLMNLVTNASEAIEGGGTVTISTHNRYLDEPLKGCEDVRRGEYVVLTVSDEGSGISPGDLERIFEPFYTKKVMGRSGTGLGLAIVWNTMQDHNAYIDVRSDPNGTAFELYFPVVREEAAALKQQAPLEDYMGNGEKILVVDDEQRQREIACGMLTRLGYAAEAVSSGAEAIEFMKGHFPDLIVLDMIMPNGISGLETYEAIAEIRPGQKVIIASGYARTKEVQTAQRSGAGKFIKKPYTLEKIGVAVKDALNDQKR
ncbi:MAG: PAS domain S-box protein [Deltaproteobacteria bacterium]|nr:PAS domain S-box protein [Deltaproteobacteria bacterium]